MACDCDCGHFHHITLSHSQIHSGPVFVDEAINIRFSAHFDGLWNKSKSWIENKVSFIFWFSMPRRVAHSNFIFTGTNGNPFSLTNCIFRSRIASQWPSFASLLCLQPFRAHRHSLKRKWFHIKCSSIRNPKQYFWPSTWSPYSRADWFDFTQAYRKRWREIEQLSPNVKRNSSKWSKW